MLASLIGWARAEAGAVLRTVQDKMRDKISVRDFGAVGDGSNEAVAIQAALTAANGRRLDFDGLVCRIDSPVSASLTMSSVIMNGGLTLGSAVEHDYVMRLRTTADLRVENFEINGINKSPKLLLINPNAAASVITVASYRGKNALQTNTATGVAVGLQIEPEDGVGTTFKRAILDDIAVSDVTSTKTDTGVLTTVGRGIYVANCYDTRINRPTIERIGPHQDGDGIAVGATNEADRIDMALSVAGGIFVDCEKRAIKSQVSRSVVTDVQVSRTAPFTDNVSGQAEIDLQWGGVVDGVLATYATGAAPNIIVAFGVFTDPGFKSVPAVCRNITVRSESQDDVINFLCSLGLNAPGALPVRTPIFENIVANCKVRNILRCYSTGTTVAAQTEIADLMLNNVQVEGFSAAAEAAVIFLTRGSLSYCNVTANMRDVVSRSNSAPLSYKDTAPGSTTFLSLQVTKARNVSASDQYQASKNTAPAGIQRFVVRENEAATKTYTLNSGAAAALVTVSYTSGRDSIDNKLITQGIVQASSVRAYYTELIAGRTTSVNTGTIAIVPNAAALEFSITKTAGITSSSGDLLIEVEDMGYAALQS
jgi:hypothetical protein